jgi:hypothetical protein
MDAEYTDSHLERIYSGYKKVGSYSPSGLLLLVHDGHSVGEYSSARITKGVWQ